MNHSLVEKLGIGFKQTWVQIPAPSGKWGGLGGRHPKSLIALDWSTYGIWVLKVFCLLNISQYQILIKGDLY